MLECLGLLRDGHLMNAADVLFCKSRGMRLKQGVLESRARTNILGLQREEGTVFDLVRKADLINEGRSEGISETVNETVNPSRVVLRDEGELLSLLVVDPGVTYDELSVLSYSAHERTSCLLMNVKLKSGNGSTSWRIDGLRCS